jgi:hypothetical protein
MVLFRESRSLLSSFFLGAVTYFLLTLLLKIDVSNPESVWQAKAQPKTVIPDIET